MSFGIRMRPCIVCGQHVGTLDGSTSPAVCSTHTQQEIDTVNRISDSLPHVTQVTLTDAQVALLLNAVQFAAVTLGIHPEAQTRDDKIKALKLAFAALDTFTPDVWEPTLDMLHGATQEFTDPKLYGYGLEDSK